jgi:hypothetical protein
MTAEEALEIIVDLIAKYRVAEKAGHRANWIATNLLTDIETMAISYDIMDYEVECDMVDDDGRFEGTITSSVRPSP